MHAFVFKLAGIDLIYPRWLLFAGAVLAQFLVYLILSRYVQPIAAAIGAWLALGWSFPNYFAALPSWWLLVCALACVWAFLRYVETGLLRYAAAAGLAAGVSILIKQTGLYVLVALVMALLYGGGNGAGIADLVAGANHLCGGGGGRLALALMILSARLALSDLRLSVPADSCVQPAPSCRRRPPVAAAVVGGACRACVPLWPPRPSARCVSSSRMSSIGRSGRS